MEAKLKRLVTPVMFAIAVSVPLLVAAPASAFYTHPFVKSFTPTAGFSTPFGVGINQSTDEIYIADTSSGSVYAFNAPGTPDPAHPELTQTDGTTPYPFAGPWGVAVDNSAGPDHGDIYVADNGDDESVLQFGPSGVRTSDAPITKANLPTDGQSQSGGLPPVVNTGSFQPLGVAVAEDGDLYVTDNANNAIDVFAPNGTFVSQLGSEHISAPRLIALGPSGNIYVVTERGLIEFDSEGNCIASCEPIDPTDPIGVAVDGHGDVYADQGSQIVEFGTSREELGTFGMPTLEPAFGGIAFSYGLAVNNTSGQVYVSDSNGQLADIFGPGDVLPDVTTDIPTGVTRTSATLQGEVSAAEGPQASCNFEYSTDESYAKSSSCEPAGPFTGSSTQNVSAELSGLAPSTTYNYRLTAKNAHGTNTTVAKTLETLPAVERVATEAPTNVTRASATLMGSFIGNGEDTHYYFEWGPGLSNKTAVEDAGSGNGPHTEAVTIMGLSPQNSYGYRFVATNSFGTTYGSEQSLETTTVVEVLGSAAATNVTATSATFNGSWKGNGEDTHYHFEWSTEAGNYTHDSPAEPADGGSASGPTTVSADLTELSPGTTYYYRIVASNSVGTATSPNEEHFTTPPAFPVVSASTGEVHSESAALHAKVNPEGGVTKYHFEYGTADCAHSSCEGTSVVEIPAGNGFKSVSAQLGGLARGTTYHYRVVASNYCNPEAPEEACTTDGPDQTFTTFSFIDEINEKCPNALSRQQTGAALLLDCRAYELVSAPDTGGYNVSSDLSEGEEAPFSGYPEAEGPPRVLYSVDHGAIPGTDHPTNKGSDPYVATRTESGWTTEYVGIPANDPEASASDPFSSIPTGAGGDLEDFAFAAPGGCSPCFADGYTGIPVRLPDGELVQGIAGSLDPGPTAKPSGYIGKELSADGSHLVFGSKSRFEPEGNEGEVSIYDRNLDTDQTYVVSKTPSGETMKEEGEQIGELDISADGSHILIGRLTGEAEGAKLWHLYLNVGDSGRTIDLTPGAGDGVRFDGMTSDGEEVFFSSAEHLTGEDELHTGPDIFMWSKQGEEEGRPLTLISTGTEGDAESCDPVANTLHEHWNTTGAENCGDVAIGGGGGVASGDGTIYFLSPSLLDGSQEPEDGVKNAPNLYVVRPGQAPHFVTTLESSLTGPLQSRHALLRSFGSFVRPEFIATDQSTGDVYVVDTAIGTIYKMNSAGEPVTSWRENGKLALGGSGIATDPSNGNLYVGVGGEVKELTPAGGVIRSFSDGTNGYEHGIAVDAAGNVYVYDSFYDYIVKFSSTGAEIGTVLSPVTATGLALDPASGELYVDREGKTVERYSFNGAGKAVNPKVVASGLLSASGIAVDSAHDVYVDDGNRIFEFNSSGEEVSVPIGAGVLSGSDAVGVGSAGDIYAGNPPHSNLAEFGPAEASPNPRTDNPVVVDAVSEPETRRTADFQVTPSGQFAAFTSTLPLGGAEDPGYPEVFRYDAADQSLACASCDGSNAEATGGSSLAANGSSLTEAGQVFFNSEEALALRDSDKLTDVYEWEPAGTGTCGPESPAYVRLSGDCLGLISTGSSPFNSKLLGVSADGVDAYFFTRDTLAPQDENGELVKIYDARVEGGFFVTPEPPPCRASDECHGAGSPPPPAPDFHVNNGTTGNEVTAAKCKKGFVEKHGKCTRKPEAHKHKKRHKKSSTHHRGGKK